MLRWYGGAVIDRLEYLARTLSRTKRKDYENYVLGALWHRLEPAARELLQPVTQQSVRDAKGSQYYVDLFFPQLNIAVECDESFHLGQAEADERRQASITDVLTPIENPDLFTTITAVTEQACEFVRIAVPSERRLEARAATTSAPLPHSTMAVTAVERQIDEAVEFIETRLAAARAAGSFRSWDEIERLSTPADFYATREEITVEDGVSFATISEISNVLLGTSYGKQSLRRGYFTPHTLHATRGRAQDFSRFKLWCPQGVSVTGSASQWQNTFSPDGREILAREHRADGPVQAQPADAVEVTPNITFIKVKDPVTREVGYRFVGIFERVVGQAGVSLDGTAQVFRRTDTRFPVLR